MVEDRDLENGDPMSLTSSLIERFNKTEGSSVPISPRELVKAMSFMADQGNGQQLKALFQAYYNWELRVAATPETEEQVKQRALDNFDTIAELADNLTKTLGDKYLAQFLVIHENKGDIGKVRRFYRQTIGYQGSTRKPKE